MNASEIKSAIRYKFRTWKHWFYIFFSLYILSFVIGTVLFSNSKLAFLNPLLSLTLTCFSANFFEALRITLISLIPFFVLFVAGPTIYAPLTAFITVFSVGLYSGVESAFIINNGRMAFGIFELIFLSSEAYILILWASMTTLSALRIFTDIKKEDFPELFTGSLFCAGGFRRVFNFRYILSYIGFYIFMCSAALIFCVLRAVAAIIF